MAALEKTLEKNLADYTAVELIVPVECAGMRLDQALARLLPQFSRSRLQQWIKHRLITLDGNAAESKQKIHGGEALRVAPQPDPQQTAFRAEEIPLAIIYEDDSLIVLDKPAGLVVHPGSGNWEGTLLNALLHHAPQLHEVPRAGIVHRLDKDTSGLLVVAKTLAAQTSLVRQLQARTVAREYLALVYGEIHRAGSVDAPLGRHPTQRTKMAVVPGGKTAVTHYTASENFPGCTLLHCRLETGRTHQIRVHLASIGHPLVGDKVYARAGRKAPPAVHALLAAFPRQALHAARLTLEHPHGGAQMQWQAPLPDDMQTLLAALRTATCL
jgi:23S rRNA pseudouridine1911/1915/1917 synthase